MKQRCAAPGCVVEFESKRSTTRYCSPRCRQRAARARRSAAGEVKAASCDTSRDIDDGGLVAAVRAELEKAGQLETVPGQQALVLARAMTKVDASGLSGLSKELSRVKAEALGESSPNPGPVAADDEDDEVKAARRRRVEKAAAAAGQ